MATVYSNKITVTLEGVAYSYSLTLSASTTDIPATGGTVTFKAVLTNTTLNKPVPNTVVTLTELNSNSSSTATTDSTGTATFSVTFPANTSSSPISYTFQASATPTQSAPSPSPSPAPIQTQPASPSTI